MTADSPAGSTSPIRTAVRPLRMVFLGTPAFAVPSLEALAAAGHRILAVYTQPDRPKGRGQALGAPPVKEAALRLGLPVHQPEKIRPPEVQDQLAALAPEVMIVVGYGKILPKAMIDRPALGILNVHASLLPKYRGAAPIQWAVASGETRTGVTIMKIDEGLDTGDMFASAALEIGPAETAEQLSPRLAQLGARLLVETLESIAAGQAHATPQDHFEASFAPVLEKEHGRIDWSRPAVEIGNRIRGFQPWPGAWSTFRGNRIHIWQAKPANNIKLGDFGSLAPAGKRLLVACGNDSALELEEIQLEGRKRMPADAFANGQRLRQNERLGEETL